MKMSLRHLAVFSSLVLVFAVVQLKGVQAQQSCAKLEALTTCFPKFTEYMERGINLSLVVRAFTGGAENINKICGRFLNLSACVEQQMHGCESVTDAAEMLVQYWNQAEKGIKFLCVDNKQIIIAQQPCLTKPEVLQGGSDCDTSNAEDHVGHRRKRHSCEDYEKEVKCTDDLVTKYCNVDIAKKTGTLTRIFLKNTPHTKDCAEPAFTSGFSPLLYSTTSTLMAIVVVISVWLL